MTPTIQYSCTKCSKPARAPLDSVLVMLALCKACADERREAGLKKQREAAQS